MLACDSKLIKVYFASRVIDEVIFGVQETRLPDQINGLCKNSAKNFKHSLVLQALMSDLDFFSQIDSNAEQSCELPRGENGLLQISFALFF